MTKRKRKAGRLATAAEYAKHRGISRQAVNDAEKRGIVARVRGGSRMIDVAASDRAWDELAMPRSNSPNGPIGSLLERAAATSPTASLNAERARKMRADADLAELRLAQKRGEVIAIDEVAREQFGVLRTLRNRLRAIPAREAALLFEISDVHGLRHRLAALIDEALLMADGDVETA